jgi:hypothetical protein
MQGARIYGKQFIKTRDTSKRCLVCKKMLTIANKSGFCDKHFNEKYNEEHKK